MGLSKSLQDRINANIMPANSVALTVHVNNLLACYSIEQIQFILDTIANPKPATSPVRIPATSVSK